MKQGMMVLLLAIAAASCKDKTTENPQPSYSSYSMLKPGNYWVYEAAYIEPGQRETLKANPDSCYVEKDTIIHGSTYFKVYRLSFDPSQRVQYLRDSLHYLVNDRGKILFSSLDFSILFSGYYIPAPGDTMYRFTRSMTDKDGLTFVPAGIFKTSTYKEVYDIYPQYTLPGLGPGIYERKHAAGIGIVLEREPFWSQNKRMYWEWRLLRYSVQ